jgi:hypothetical protein
MSRNSEGMSENASKLLELARKRFGKLNEAEGELFRSIADGEVADRSDESEENNDPSGAGDWDKDKRAIRAECIFWLCTDRKALELATHRGVRVKGACIDGELDLSDARIPFPLYFEKSAFPVGIKLQNAEIRNLDLDGTRTGPLNADGLRISYDLCLHNNFKAEGEVRLQGANIGGTFRCERGQFINKNEKEAALNADRLKVEGDVFLRTGFRAEGEVCLRGAKIDGAFQCDKGQFIKPDGVALRADRLKVEGGVFLRNNLKVEGKVSLVGATIGGYLVWRGVDSPKKALLDLRSARIGTLWDERKSWPGKGKLSLHGLVYDDIHDEALEDARTRLDWLRRQYNDKAEKDKDQFRPQPYEQLAEVLRKAGREVEAKDILIAKNRDKAHLTRLTLPEKIWYRQLGRIIGYGYRPLRALWWMLFFIFLGCILFGFGYWSGLITPQTDSAYLDEQEIENRQVKIVDPGDEGRYISDVYPKFNSLMYSFDLFVPLVDLHHSKYLLPNANRGVLFEKYGISVRTGGLLRLYMWIHIALGWILTSLLVVGLTGLVLT